MSELKITQEKVTAAFSEANDCPKAISILLSSIIHTSKIL